MLSGLYSSPDAETAEQDIKFFFHTLRVRFRTIITLLGL
jgi:hypothetical protein